MLRLAWLCSRRAPGLAYLLERQGHEFEVVTAVTTDPASEALDALRHAGVPALVHDIRAFCAARGAPRRDRHVRRAFDTRTVELLAPFRPDLLVLSGYLHVVTEPLLAAYPQRVINVHDADLALRDGAGRPRYPGLHATRDAVRAGELVTRCSVHLVTADVDAGPVLARSGPFPVSGRHHYLQREWMMQAAWGPLIVRAIQQVAAGVNRRGEASRGDVEENRMPVGAGPVVA